jgi:hypothetical protein
MKEYFKEAVADVEAQMGDLKGFVVMAIDDEKQFNTMKGTIIKMFAQLGGENAEFIDIMEQAVRVAKLDKMMAEFVEKAKEVGFDLDEIQKEG